MPESYKPLENYILSCIDGSGYDKKLTTRRGKLLFLRETFLAEYGWNVKQVGEHKALTNWLSGLPSSCNIEFRNHVILQIAEKLGFDVSTEKKADLFLNTWFSRCAMRIIGMWRNTKVKGIL